MNDPAVRRVALVSGRFLKVRQLTASVAVLSLSVLISVGIFLLRGHLKQFAALGYLGVLLISLLANATVILPVPSTAAIVAAAAAGLNPFLIGVVAGLGAAIGELTGYLAGYAGHAVIENRDFYNRILPWIRRLGPWAIFILAAIPNPFFDIAGMAAGVLRMSLWRFFLFCWAGKIVNMTLIAHLGAWVAPLFGG